MKIRIQFKSLFWCQSWQIFEVRAIEQRHHEFQLIHMPPYQFWPLYHSVDLSPVHVRFEIFSKQICYVEALVCHFYKKKHQTLTHPHFPRDADYADIVRTGTIFYRYYKGLHQMRKDLVLFALGFYCMTSSLCRQITDLNYTWIAGSHGFAYSSMRATGNTLAAILLQSKHLIDTLISTHVSAWNATGDRFLASNFMKILRKKWGKFPRSSRLLIVLLKIAKKFTNVN